jgi:hypothetical protein
LLRAWWWWCCRILIGLIDLFAFVAKHAFAQCTLSIVVCALWFVWLICRICCGHAFAQWWSVSCVTRMLCFFMCFDVIFTICLIFNDLLMWFSMLCVGICSWHSLYCFFYKMPHTVM